MTRKGQAKAFNHGVTETQGSSSHGMAVPTHAMSGEEDVVDAGDDGERGGSVKKSHAGDPDPAQTVDLEQKREEYRGDLSEGVGFAEDAGSEVTQTGNGVEDDTGAKNRKITAENQHRIFPGNIAENGKHEEHGAEQKFVGDGIEILPQQSLLMQAAGKQAVEAIAETGKDEKNQRPEKFALDNLNHDEGNENHAQQRELIGRAENLGELHG